MSSLFPSHCFSFLPPDNIDDEDGEFKSKEDREHRHTAETEKLRVTWNTERRCYLDSLATKRCVLMHLSFQRLKLYIQSQYAKILSLVKKLDYNAQYPKFCFYYSFQDKIAKCRYWPVEVMRLPQPAAAKGKKVSLIPSVHFIQIFI